MNKKEYRKWYNKGKKMMGKDNFREALNFFTKAIKANINFAPAYWHRSYCNYRIENRKQEAICDLNKYLELVQDTGKKALANASLGIIYASGEDMYSNDMAIEYLEKAIELDPRCHLAYVQRKYAYNFRFECLNKGKSIETDNLDAALRASISAYELSPVGSFRVNEALRSCWDDQGVIDIVTKLINEFPSSAPLYYFLGLAHCNNNEFNLALECLNKSIEFNPDSFCGINLRGLLYFWLDKCEEAFQDFTKAIILRPDNPVAYQNRSLVYCMLGWFDLAIIDLEEAILLSEGDDEYKDLLAKLLMILQGLDLKIIQSDSINRKHMSIDSGLAEGRNQLVNAEWVFSTTLDYF